MDFELIYTAFPKILGGLDKTIILALASLSIGIILAVIIALAELSRYSIIKNVAKGYVYLFRSTPLLIQIFLIYYGSGQFHNFLDSIGLWMFFKDAWFCAILALSLNTGAYTSQIIRGAIETVPFGSIEAAYAIGMTKLKAFTRIIFPIAIRIALPAYGNEVILMVKSTSLASTITIMEITGVSKKIIAMTYQPIEVFMIAGFIYLMLNFILTQLMVILERYLMRHTY